MSDYNASFRKILITSRLGKSEGFTNGKIAYFDQLNLCMSHLDGKICGMWILSKFNILMIMKLI